MTLRAALASVLPVFVALGCSAAPPPATPVDVAVVNLDAGAQGEAAASKGAPQASTSTAEAAEQKLREALEEHLDEESADEALARIAENQQAAQRQNEGLAGVLSPLEGNVWGDDSTGDGYGFGGLGLSGIGVAGGGGRGEGIGLGTIGRIGQGAGTGTGQGFGGGRGRLGGAQADSRPKVRQGATTVTGRLPPEIVQRIVRQRFGSVRACYEKGLAKNPGLGGQVTTRFTIGADGSVVKAENAGSDLPDQEVVACVVGVFKGLSFPKPEQGGVVTVTYPVKFATADAPPAAQPATPAPSAAPPSSQPAPVKPGAPAAKP
ncbi:AgmX/PglI C-terminal domain-containing protein [Chondromyces apiculatus]|nr:AgmX/PglI C-terminal domain-containing protein [Chondromyces apiculatus]